MWKILYSYKNGTNRPRQTSLNCDVIQIFLPLTILSEPSLTEILAILVSFFTFYFIYVHGDLDPRPVLHERHLRGRGERRRHERGHEQGVHQRGEVKTIISNNVYQAEIFILDFNNALCLNFGFSYFLSFCAGSFFMVITLIFKLNNCVICTQAKMGFIWQFLYIPVIIHPLNFTKGHGGKGSIIYFFEGIPKQWFLIMYKVLFRNWTFSWWIFSIKA